MQNFNIHSLVLVVLALAGLSVVLKAKSAIGSPLNEKSQSITDKHLANEKARQNVYVAKKEITGIRYHNNGQDSRKVVKRSNVEDESRARRSGWPGETLSREKRSEYERMLKIVLGRDIINHLRKTEKRGIIQRAPATNLMQGGEPGKLTPAKKHHMSARKEEEENNINDAAERKVVKAHAGDRQLSGNKAAAESLTERKAAEVQEKTAFAVRNLGVRAENTKAKRYAYETGKDVNKVSKIRSVAINSAVRDVNAAKAAHHAQVRHGESSEGHNRVRKNVDYDKNGQDSREVVKLPGARGLQNEGEYERMVKEAERNIVNAKDILHHLEKTKNKGAGPQSLRGVRERDTARNKPGTDLQNTGH